MPKDPRRCRAALIGGFIAGAIAGATTWASFGWKWGMALGLLGAVGGALLSWGTADSCGDEPPWPPPSRSARRPNTRLVVIVVWVLVAAGPVFKDMAAVTPWVPAGAVMGMLAGGRFYWVLGVIAQFGIGLYAGMNRPSSQGVPARA